MANASNKRPKKDVSPLWKAVHRKGKSGITNSQKPPSLSARPHQSQCCPWGHRGSRPCSVQQLHQPCLGGSLPGNSRETELTSSQLGSTSHTTKKATVFHHSCSWLQRYSLQDTLPGGDHHLSLHFPNVHPFPSGSESQFIPFRVSVSLAACRHRVLSSILTHFASVEGAINFIFICL